MSLYKLFALRAFASDYHSGQWSRGYKILSLTYLRLQAKNIPTHEYEKCLKQSRKSPLYKQLVRDYANKM